MTPPLAPPPGPVVVKVGGSLYDHPGLGPGLREWLAGLGPGPVVVVPGGGAFADAVRALDRVHRLGEEAAHRVALGSLRAAAAFLRELVPGADVLDADAFCESRPAVPRTWAVTTDSIAAYAAAAAGARLVLLKSVGIPAGTPWQEAAARGWVDAHFPAVVARQQVCVLAVNFRGWLDRRSAGPVEPVD